MGRPPTGEPRDPRSVTLRMVAAHAGVSKSVVSRVLQDSPHVSPEKRAVVEEAIRTLGYRPNAAARSLTQRRTMAVGVIVSDLGQPWFAGMLEGLGTVLARRRRAGGPSRRGRCRRGRGRRSAGWRGPRPAAR